MTEFYVYCRSWLHFSDRFPYFDELNSVPDDLICGKLERLAFRYLHDDIAELRKRWRAQKARVTAGMKHRASQSIGRPGSYSMRTKARRVIWRPFRETIPIDALEEEARCRGISVTPLLQQRRPSTGVRIARIAGWMNSCVRKFGNLSPSRMLVVLRAEPSIAEAVAAGLEEQFGHLDYEPLRLRFGSISVSEFDLKLQAKLLARLDSALAPRRTPESDISRVSSEEGIHRLVAKAALPLAELVLGISRESGDDEGGVSRPSNSLSPAGEEGTNEARIAFTSLRPAAQVAEKSDEAAKPEWDEDRRELRLGKTVCKSYRRGHARNQILVLSLFQESGWPPKLDDPLPPKTDLDPKRRLIDRISSLNKGLTRIRFRGDGTGTAILWELATSQ